MREIYAVYTNKRSDCYEPLQQHKHMKQWRWMRLDLIFTMRDIYINSNMEPLTKFSSSRRNTQFKDIDPLNFTHMIVKTFLISTRMVISCGMERCIPFWIWRKVNGNWEKYTIRMPRWIECYCTANTRVRRKKEIQKSRTLRVTVRGLSRKVNHLAKFVWDRKIMTEFSRSISSTSIGQPVLMIDVKVCKSKYISRCADWENLNYFENYAPRQIPWLIEVKELRHECSKASQKHKWEFAEFFKDMSLSKGSLSFT